MRSRRASVCLPLSFVMLLLGAPLCTAADAAEEAPKPKTIGNPRISRSDLELQLQPLRTEQLKVEVEGWLGLVQKKVTEISAAELAVRRQNREIEARKAAASKAEDADSQLKEAQTALEKAKATGNQSDIKEATDALKTAQEALRSAEEAAQNAEKSGEDEVAEPEAESAVEDKRSAQEKVQDAIQKATEAKEARDAEAAAKQASEQEAAQAADAVETPAATLSPTAAPDAEAQKQEAEKKAEVKTALLDQLATLRDERTALVDRAGLVVDRFATVGGEAVASDVTNYKSYLSAVSGAVTVDPTDLEATIANLTNWVKSPEGGIKWGINIAKFFGVLIVFMIVSRIAGRAVQRGIRVARNMSALLREFIVNSVKRTILAIGFLVAISVLGVEIGPLLALIGAAGFVIAFALQGTLSNFASGLLILLYRPFDVGDVVDVAGVLGKVNAMTLMSTTLTTPDNKLVIVPNNSIWGSVITNVTGSSTRRVDMVFGIGYGDDIEKAHRLLEEITTSHPLVLKDPAPVIQLHELADSSVNFVCRPWSKTSDYWDVYWGITRQVKQRFDAEGVTIPFPQRDVHVYNEALPGSGAAK